MDCEDCRHLTFVGLHDTGAKCRYRHTVRRLTTRCRYRHTDASPVTLPTDHHPLPSFLTLPSAFPSVPPVELFQLMPDHLGENSEQSIQTVFMSQLRCVTIINVFEVTSPYTVSFALLGIQMELFCQVP